jgi:hypothetical protein
VRKGIKNIDFKGNRIAAVHGSSNLNFNGKKIYSVNDLLGNNNHSFSSIIRSIDDSNQLLAVLVGIPDLYDWIDIFNVKVQQSLYLIFYVFSNTFR